MAHRPKSPPEVTQLQLIEGEWYWLLSPACEAAQIFRYAGPLNQGGFNEAQRFFGPIARPVH